MVGEQTSGMTDTDKPETPPTDASHADLDAVSDSLDGPDTDIDHAAPLEETSSPDTTDDDGQPVENPAG